jgi:hypothetical protein
MIAFIRRYPRLFIFLLALLIRLINLALIGRTPAAYFAQSDSDRYWAIGRIVALTGQIAVAHDGGLEPVTDLMPIYPLFVGAMQWVFGDVPAAVAVAQAVVDAASCTVIASLGAMLGPAVGLVAGVLAAVSINLTVHSSQILTDTLFVFFFSLMLLNGARFLRDPWPRHAAVAGASAGLALATRPVVAGLVVVAVPLIVAAALHHGKRTTGAAAMAALFSLSAVAPVTPTLLSNFFNYHVVSLTSQGGGHLLNWIVPLVTQRNDGTPYQLTVDRLGEVYRRQLAELGLSDGEIDDFHRSAIKTELAYQGMRQLPAAAFVMAWAEGMVVNLASPAVILDPRVRSLSKPSFYSTGGTSLTERARAYLFDDFGTYQALLLAGLGLTLPFVLLQCWGLVLLARQEPWAALFAAGVLAYYLMINGPVATPKYRLPMEPVLIVLSALAIVRLSARLRTSCRSYEGCSYRAGV